LGTCNNDKTNSPEGQGKHVDESTLQTPTYCPLLPPRAQLFDAAPHDAPRCCWLAAHSVVASPLRARPAEVVRRGRGRLADHPARSPPDLGAWPLRARVGPSAAQAATSTRTTASPSATSPTHSTADPGNCLPWPLRVAIGRPFGRRADASPQPPRGGEPAPPLSRVAMRRIRAASVHPARRRPAWPVAPLAALSRGSQPCLVVHRPRFGLARRGRSDCSPPAACRPSCRYPRRCDSATTPWVTVSAPPSGGRASSCGGGASSPADGRARAADDRREGRGTVGEDGRRDGDMG
jgi:hypothetical protein